MATIEEKIARYEARVKDPKLPADQKKKFQANIKKLKARLSGEETKPKPSTSKPKPSTSKPKPSTSKPKPSTSKPKPSAGKKDTTPPKQTQAKRGIIEIDSQTVEIDGVRYDKDSQEFCDYLVANWNERRAKAKAQKKKKKTSSVMSKVSTNIEKGVSQAIKAGVKTKKKQIEKNPSAFLTKVKALETATAKFLRSLKDVMGSDYEAKEVNDTVKSIKGMVEELKKKVSK